MSHMPQESPESIVEAFTAKPTGTPGRGCGTCAHPQAEDINRAIEKFVEMKTSGDTTHSWKDFHKHVLVPNFNYTLSVWSMRHHIKECLGHE